MSKRKPKPAAVTPPSEFMLSVLAWWPDFKSQIVIDPKTKKFATDFALEKFARWQEVMA